MKKAKLNPFVVPLMILVLAGCRSPSSQSLPINLTEKGRWIGKAAVVTLYEDNNKPIQALCITIPSEKIRKRIILSNRPVLIDTNFCLIDFHNYIGKTLEVRGMIYKDMPINPQDGKHLFSGENAGSTLFDPIWSAVDVISISPSKIRILNTTEPF